MSVMALVLEKKQTKLQMVNWQEIPYIPTKTQGYPSEVTKTDDNFTLVFS